MSDSVMLTGYIDHSLHAKLRQLAFHLNVSKSDIISVALNQIFDKWGADAEVAKLDLSNVLSKPDAVVVSTYVPDEHVKNWRARRIETVRAAALLRKVVDNINEDDGQYPREASPQPRTESEKIELTNLVNLAMRMILLTNDGQVSPSLLQAF